MSYGSVENREGEGMRDKAGDSVIEAARALAPLIGSHREAIRRERALSEPLVDAMRDADLFQLSLPRSMGGPEFHPLVSFEAVEALSRADGSVGWCASISSSISLFCGGWLPVEVGRSLFGTPADARCAGSVRAEGRALRAPGGYLASGQWDFASGIQHARWLFCTCVVMEGEEVVTGGSGTPVTRSLMVPREAAQIVDTWSVAGLEGTGSHDFVVDKVFVPEAHAFWVGAPPVNDGLLYSARLAMLSAWTTTAAVSLGIARGALDAFAELASARGSSGSTALLRDRPRVQLAVGEAEAILGGARAFLLSAVEQAWGAIENKHSAPGADIARARLAITHAQHEAVRVVDRVFHAAGTNAVYRKNHVERFFRDAQVAAQHAAGQTAHIEMAGRVLLGGELNEPGW